MGRRSWWIIRSASFMERREKCTRSMWAKFQWSGKTRKALQQGLGRRYNCSRRQRNAQHFLRRLQQPKSRKWMKITYRLTTSTSWQKRSRTIWIFKAWERLNSRSWGTFNSEGCGSPKYLMIVIKILLKNGDSVGTSVGTSVGLLTKSVKVWRVSGFWR